MVYFLLADGFEETEAIAPADLLRRAGFDVNLVSIKSDLIVKSVHDVNVVCDLLVTDIDLELMELLVIPGGGPGVENLDKFSELDDILNYAVNNNIPIGAICAAPSLLGKRDLLKGKRVVCFPGFEKYLNGAEIVDSPVVIDGNIITSKAAGTAIDFGLELIKYLKGKDFSDNIKNAIFY